MVYMYHRFLIHLSADGHLGCFRVLAIINSAALFSIARSWKQLKPPTDEWIKKLWYLHTMEYYSAIKIMHLSQF